MNPIQGPSGSQINLLEDSDGDAFVSLHNVEGGGAQANNTDDDDSDTDSIIDISKERGLKFHLKKKSECKTPMVIYLNFSPPPKKKTKNYRLLICTMEREQRLFQV